MAEEPRKLPRTAYELREGETYTPYTHGQTMPEMTVKAVICGIFLGVGFGAANTYLGLTAGLTISTSIPVAVLTVVVFKLLATMGAKHNILEANTSQTIGSASSSVASGALFTLPALFIWGLAPEWKQLTLLAMAGGLIGILAMIPLRRYLIKEEHGKLPYPEGLACGEVLVAADQGGKQAANVFWGIGVGIVAKFLTSGVKWIGETFSMALPFKAGIAVKVSPALLGVGYILGPRIGTIMVAGSALSALILIPAINLWGSGMTAPFFPETELLITDMTASQIWNRYIRYIGAGAVAAGGIITLIQSIPAMIASFKIGFEQLKKRRDGVAKAIDRTQLDLSFKVIGVFVAAILLVLTFVPGILGYLDSYVARGVASVMIAVFAFFFVTVSSRIVGLVGVTSNPTSGMTIATLIGTSLVFFLMHWTGMEGKATALMVGTAVCIAASIAGDTSQDLKTGYLLGATPRLQQIGELVGVITSAGAVCYVLMLLDKTQTLGSDALPAPQAMLMKLVVDGVIDQQLPWNLVMIGAGIAVAVYFLRIPPLPFAVGVYLPLSTMAPVFLGGMLRWLMTRRKSEEEADRRKEQGVLFGSGLVGGEGITGVLFAFWVGVVTGKKIEGMPLGLPGWLAQVVSVLGIAALMYIIARAAKRRVN